MAEGDFDRIERAAPMARYPEVTRDLIARLTAGEFPVGGEFLSIARVQDHYGIAINTARAALAPLKEAGLISIEQGRTPLVTAVPATSAEGDVDVLEQLLSARHALDAAIRALQAQH